MDSAEIATRAADLTARLRAASGGGRPGMSVIELRRHRRPRLRPARGRARPVLRSVWAWTWPKGLAIVLVLATWQLVVWSGWRPQYVLPSPAETLSAAVGDARHRAVLVGAVATTVAPGRRRLRSCPW